jgi:tetratricopeptide (TPR) repeat protein/TolB-like protein
MTPERWTRLVALFDAAVERPALERPAMLAAACPDDPALADEVARMLESDVMAGGFGESPAFHLIATKADEPVRPSPAASLESGSRLGRYEIIEFLDAGGMGEVYRARDPELRRDVGIKVLSHDDGMPGDQLERLGHEARAVAALSHPNILTVYDVGVDRRIPYVVSELLGGETLRARLQRGALPAAEATAIALQILSGLSTAHDKGVIHRDLKPENLFITTDGVVKILDFGLATQAERAAGDDTLDSDRGLLMGTAGYMAPEQVRGQPADALCDLFSFGAVLYEMLTGQRAFAGDSSVEILHAVLTVQPRMPDTVYVALRSVVDRCLSKEAAHRFTSAHEAATALAAAAPVAPIPVRRLRRYTVYAAAAALVLATIAAPMLVQRRPAPPRPGATGRPALAVLSFDDRSGDPAAAWLSHGVASMLVTTLAQTPGLDVIGMERLEASFKELGKAPLDRSARGEVARHAGAGAMLVGTLFKAGSEIRLDVQVEDVDTGRVVVARSRQGSDLFGVVDVIAKDVRAALDVADRSAGRPLRDVTTTSLGAYELYEKAQQARHNNRWGDARTLFEEALRIDPAFTLARAQLVTMLDRLGEQTRAQAERNIVKGQLDRLPERQRLLAEAVQEYDADPGRALALLERLIERYPDEDEAYDAMVHAYTHSRHPAYWGKTLAFMQRWARAVPGPGSGHFHNHFGYAYIEHSLFTEAEREFRAYVRASPDEANAYDSLAELFLMTGRPAMAIEHYDEAIERNPQFGWSRFGRVYALAALGRYDEAFAGLETLENLGPRAGVPSAVVHMLQGFLCARVGRYEEAAGHLDAAWRRAREQGDPGAEADADLFAAALAVERGQHRRAVEYADRAARAGSQAPLDIMRARRASLAHLIAGVAETRGGLIDAARRRAAAQARLDVSGDPIQMSGARSLIGEIALAEGRLDEAEAAFRASEYQINSSFTIYPALVVLANNLPFRDGLARTAQARGNLARAIDEYRRLNRPDVTSKWNSVFEPRYALAAARLAARAGDAAVSGAERARFTETWKAGNPSPIR